MSFCHKSMSRRPSLMTRNCSADSGPSSKKKKKKKKKETDIGCRLSREYVIMIWLLTKVSKA